VSLGGRRRIGLLFDCLDSPVTYGQPNLLWGYSLKLMRLIFSSRIAHQQAGILLILCTSRYCRRAKEQQLGSIARIIAGELKGRPSLFSYQGRASSERNQTAPQAFETRQRSQLCSKFSGEPSA
jgi:hypothetical protein